MSAPAVAPTFATDAAYAADADPWASDPNKVDPSAPRRAEGFEPDTLPAEWLNFMLNNHGAWLSYLSGLGRGGSFPVDITAPAFMRAGDPDPTEWVREFTSGHYRWKVAIAAPSYGIIYFPLLTPIVGARIVSVSLRGAQASSSGGFRMSYSIAKLDADGVETTQVQSTSKEHSAGSTALLTSTLTLPTPEVTDGTSLYFLRVAGNIVSGTPSEIRSASMVWDVP